MASALLPGIQGIWGCFDDGECDWTDKMNSTLLSIDQALHKCVTGNADGSLSIAAPASPSPGDAYIDSTGCVRMYVSAEKGWNKQAPVCGQTIYDEVNNQFYFYDGSQWLPLAPNDTVLPTSMSPKDISEFPTGTLAYSGTGTTLEEFVTINGVWAATGRLYDTTTCLFTYLLTKEQVEDCLLFVNADADATNALKPTAPPTPIAGQIGVFSYLGTLWKIDENGDMDRFLCASDLFESFADDAAAEVGLCGPFAAADAGRTYYNSTERCLRIWDGAQWIDTKYDHGVTCTLAGVAPGTVGQLVYNNAGVWTLADASVPATIGTHVIAEIDAITGEYEIQAVGPVDFPAHGFTLGAFLYQDPLTPGAFTETQPTPTSQPVAQVLSADKLELFIVNGNPVASEPCDYKINVMLTDDTPSELNFNNLVAGRTYRLTMAARVENVSNEDTTLVAVDPSNNFFLYTGFAQVSGTNIDWSERSTIFSPAASGSLTFIKGAATGTLVGGGDTYAILEELKNHNLTTKWD